MSREDALAVRVLALEETLREIEDLFVCECDEVWTGRDLHDPNCLFEYGDRVRAALSSGEV